MIQTENIIINGRHLTRTYSDSGYYIQRDGVRYTEAIDPATLADAWKAATNWSTYADHIVGV